MSDFFQNVDVFKELEYYSPGEKYAVRQVQIGPGNHFDKIEIVDLIQHKVLFTLPDEVTYVTGSEYEKELGWRGENDLFLYVIKGLVNPVNSKSTNEIIHISLEKKAVVESCNPHKSGGSSNIFSFFPLGFTICRSSDKTCYAKVSGLARITVYFKDTRCVFNNVVPLIGHPSLAKWSPDCTHCCFMGRYGNGGTRLISIYKCSDLKAGMDAWNLGRVPDDVIFEERKYGVSCVPILQGEKIYKRPFYYDDSIYNFAILTKRVELSELSISQPLSESSSHTAASIDKVNSEHKAYLKKMINRDAKQNRVKQICQKLRDFFVSVGSVLGYIVIRLVIYIAFFIVVMLIIMAFIELIKYLCS